MRTKFCVNKKKKKPQSTGSVQGPMANQQGHPTKSWTRPNLSWNVMARHCVGHRPNMHKYTFPVKWIEMKDKLFVCVVNFQSSKVLSVSITEHCAFKKALISMILVIQLGSMGHLLLFHQYLKQHITSSTYSHTPQPVLTQVYGLKSIITWCTKEDTSYYSFLKRHLLLNDILLMFFFLTCS